MIGVIMAIASLPSGGYPISQMYEALASVETGSQTNPWIRTKHRPVGGSTAYGPVQMTGTLLRDMLERHPELFDTHETRYIRRLLTQAEHFCTHGGARGEPGYMPEYDYGGQGDCDRGTVDRHLYKRVALAILGHLFEKKGTLEGACEAWRGCPDKPYIERIKNIIGDTHVS